MKDGYKYINGQVVVFDYDKDNNLREEERKYQDNIEELLMAENVREYLLNYRDEINEVIDYVNREISACIEVCAIMGFVSLVIGLIFGVLLSLAFPVAGTIIGSIAGLGIIGSITLAVVYVKKMKKELNGGNLALKGIEEELESCTIKLRGLVNDDRVEKEDIKGRNYVQLNYVQELKRLREYLELWRIVGENEKKFFKYYEQDRIYTKLSDDFKTEEITTLKRILDKNRKRY